MDCVNHQDVPAPAICTACAEPFCDDCLVTIHEQQYCGSCKVITIKSLPPPTEGLVACQEADDALRYAIIGMFCFGIVLEPMALSKAAKAKRRMEVDPRLTGAGKLRATYVIASLVLTVWILGMFTRFGAR